MALNVKRGGGRSAPNDSSAIETPSQRIVNSANKVDYVVTPNGVRLGIRKLSAFDEMRVTKAVGRENSSNEQYMLWCMMAAAIASIDSDVLPLPETPLEFEAVIQRIGDDGVIALQKRGIELAAAAQHEAKKRGAKHSDATEEFREEVKK